MTRRISSILLWILNRINLGNSPIDPRYGMIDNIHLYSREFLVESGNLEPEIPLRRFMWEMEQMDKCRGGSALTVFENGVPREATEQDIYDVTHL